ncbi:hypothetical protein O9992_25740 [Vibrio lentus]|nr:hypothetical protein [Vibrio lentus]
MYWERWVFQSGRKAPLKKTTPPCKLSRSSVRRGFRFCKRPRGAPKEKISNSASSQLLQAFDEHYKITIRIAKAIIDHHCNPAWGLPTG